MKVVIGGAPMTLCRTEETRMQGAPRTLPDCSNQASLAEVSQFRTKKDYCSQSRPTGYISINIGRLTSAIRTEVEQPSAASACSEWRMIRAEHTQRGTLVNASRQGRIFRDQRCSWKLPKIAGLGRS